MASASPPGRAPWRGRLLAFAGILLVALNLRTAVAALSPILGTVASDIPMHTLGIGMLGMLPPMCFAVFGILTPLIVRRASLETVTVIALAAILVGTVARSLADSFLLLTAGSVLAFAGMAIGNVLLPPLVKRYFHDRVGAMTALYAAMIAVSTLTPPLIAVPVAAEDGWRLSIGMWAALALIAAVPWLPLAAKSGAAARSTVPVDVEESDPRMLRLLLRSPVAWSMTVLFSVSSLNAYAMFAWLPEILHDVAGASPAEAGALLSLYAAAGIPTGIIVPVLAARLRNVAVIAFAGAGFFVLGYLGLLFAPAAVTWLWVLMAGWGPLLFPLCLVMVNLRSRTHAGAVALSGFSQGIGYTVAAVGPLAVAALHQVTGGWHLVLVVLIGTAVAAAAAGMVAARHTMLEDTVVRPVTEASRRGARAQQRR